MTQKIELDVGRKKRKKTFREKKKMLDTTIFSFSINVLKNVFVKVVKALDHVVKRKKARIVYFSLISLQIKLHHTKGSEGACSLLTRYHDL